MPSLCSAVWPQSSRSSLERRAQMETHRWESNTQTIMNYNEEYCQLCPQFINEELWILCPVSMSLEHFILHLEQPLKKHMRMMKGNVCLPLILGNKGRWSYLYRNRSKTALSFLIFWLQCVCTFKDAFLSLPLKKHSSGLFCHFH